MPSAGRLPLTLHSLGLGPVQYEMTFYDQTIEDAGDVFFDVKTNAYPRFSSKASDIDEYTAEVEEVLYGKIDEQADLLARARLTRDLTVAQARIVELESFTANSGTQIDALQRTVARLIKNISSLFNTALLEIARKNEEIESLRQQVDRLSRTTSAVDLGLISSSILRGFAYTVLEAGGGASNINSAAIAALNAFLAAPQTKFAPHLALTNELKTKGRLKPETHDNPSRSHSWSCGSGSRREPSNRLSSNVNDTSSVSNSYTRSRSGDIGSRAGADRGSSDSSGRSTSFTRSRSSGNVGGPGGNGSRADGMHGRRSDHHGSEADSHSVSLSISVIPPATSSPDTSPAPSPRDVVKKEKSDEAGRGKVTEKANEVKDRGGTRIPEKAVPVPKPVPPKPVDKPVKPVAGATAEHAATAKPLATVGATQKVKEEAKVTAPPPTYSIPIKPTPPAPTPITSSIPFIPAVSIPLIPADSTPSPAATGPENEEGPAPSSLVGQFITSKNTKVVSPSKLNMSPTRLAALSPSKGAYLSPSKPGLSPVKLSNLFTSKPLDLSPTKAPSSNQPSMSVLDELARSPSRESSVTPVKRSVPECRFFATTGCRAGDSCRFAHTKRERSASKPRRPSLSRSPPRHRARRRSRSRGRRRSHSRAKRTSPHRRSQSRSRSRRGDASPRSSSRRRSKSQRRSNSSARRKRQRTRSPDKPASPGDSKPPLELAPVSGDSKPPFGDSKPLMPPTAPEPPADSDEEEGAIIGSDDEEGEITIV